MKLRFARPVTTNQVGLRRWCTLCLVLALVGASLAIAPTARAAAIVVNTLGDVVDAGGGNCGTLTIDTLPGPDSLTSLREAICAANNTAGADTITFQAGLSGTITLLNGELAIGTEMSIIGPGMDQLTIDGNDASRVIAISGFPSGTVNLQGLMITRGKYAGGGMQAGGGGIAITTNMTVNITATTISENRALGEFGFGGGINITSGKVNLTDSVISKNSANLSGGGIAFSDGTLAIANSTVSNNTADRGGGIEVGRGEVSLTETVLRDNIATGVGGGMRISGGSQVTLATSLLRDNTAALGGGLANVSGSVPASLGTLLVTNTTISGNTATSFGGGAYTSGGSTTFLNSTVTNNLATTDSPSASGAGGVLGDGGALNLRNTIVAGNTASNGQKPDCSGTISSQGHNLLGSIGDCMGIPADIALSGAINTVIDPQLRSNGGTTDTHALASNSPARDTGDPANCPATDQRGKSRPQGAGCDIGAFETVAYLLSLDVSGNGSISPDTTNYYEGASATITAIAAAGYSFTGWLVDGQPAGWANPLTITMEANHSARADFTPVATFGDVTGGGPYDEAIAQLAARGIIKGCDQESTPKRFCPDETTLRAQMAALIARAMAWGGPAASNPFTDRCDPLNAENCVDAELWNAVGQLAGRNVARGYTDEATCAPAAAPCYAPRDNVLYAQVISFITRAMVAQGYWTQATTDDGTIYPNIPQESGHRLDVVTYVANAGPLPGTASATGAFPAWDQASTRAWFAEALWRALERYFGADQPGRGGYVP